MTFSSLVFLTVFFPVTFLLYFIAGRNIKLKNAILILASLVFYGWSGIQYLMIIIVSSIVNYGLGLVVHRNGRQNKAYLIIAVCFNLLIIGFFKYFNFLTDNLSALSIQIFGTPITTPRIPLPIGISFFTFQILSYVVDVYRGKVDPQRNYFRVLLYIVFFPQLIAGPIVRYIDIEREIISRRSTIDDITEGAFRFIQGLCKKVLIANQVAQIAKASFGNVAGSTSGMAWLGIICYTLQIYYDFSGYSDMAIGMGRMFGFHFLENFNYPYIAKSIQEFWRRWHISLSSWFRDYVYIPLGGNRKGIARTYLNLIIVFFLTGLWHGAGWNFIIWGLFNGVFQLIERNKTVHRVLEKAPALLTHLYAILVVMIGWVFFESETIEASFAYLGKMFAFQDMSVSPINTLLTPLMITVILLGIIFSTPLIPFIWGKFTAKYSGLQNSKSLFVFKAILCLASLFFCIVKLATGEFNPFIYFRF